MTASLGENLTSRLLLFKNISFNFGIAIFTVILGIFTVPFIMKGLGLERFGILSVIWSIIGYSSLFDFDLGKALTRMVSKCLADNHIEEIPSLVWTAVISISVVSGLVMVGMFIGAPLLVHFLKMRAIYRPETIDTVRLLAISLPALIGMAAVRGVLEAYQQFFKLSLLRLPVLFCNYIMPLFILPFIHSLSVMVAVLVAGRILVYIGHFFLVAQVVPHFFQKFEFRRSHLKPLLSFGGWSTVSGVILPLMTYLDRVSIAFLMTSAVIAYYSTPYDLIMRGGFVPAVVMSVMFPALTSEFHKNNLRSARDLYLKSMLYMLALLAVPLTIAAVFARPLLGLWINPDFATHSYLLARLICIDFLIGALNLVPFNTIQARGRSDVTARIHLFEFPIYIAVLYFAVKHYGLVGASVAALTRVVLDSIILHIIANRYLNTPVAHPEAIEVDQTPIMDDVIPVQPMVG